MERKPSFSPSSSSSSSSPPAKRFDVFLSFRGEDTRNNFTGFLSLALRKIGLFNIFKDDYALDKGKDIGTELMKAIEDSQYAVVVLSENYATSSWCLKELTKIVKCMEDPGRIRTIFYHVNPSHVRNVISSDVKKQKESSYWKALKEHAENPNHSQYLESWRNALVKVANQSGHHVEAHTNEAIFVKNFVKDISRELGASIRTTDGLFGMTSRLKELDSYVLQSLDTDDVCFLGIHGMGGIGKSTLAETYYTKMSHKFDGSSFLQNVREVCEKNANGLVHLQEKLLEDILGEKIPVGHAREGIDLIRSRLRAKKVLIILDDVNNSEHLEALVDSHRKKQGSENELDKWFRSRSVIIVTTRNENSLRERYKIYRAQQLDDNEACQLFSWKAFESIEPPDEFKELSKEVVKYSSYLPLALTVLGSLLRRKKKSEWESALCRLRKCPEKKIVEKLKISFDELDRFDQAIFLDIACFYKGFPKDKVIEILDSCGFDSTYGIRNLIDRSLLSNDEYGRIWMHDLLQKMGKDMGKQSRIWDKDYLYEISDNKEGMKEVEAISIDYYEKYSFEALSSMKNLRLLHIRSDPPWNWDGDSEVPDACEGPELSNNLKYLEWFAFPYEKFPPSFQPRKLVELKLHCNNIRQLWSNIGIKPLYNLKVMDLSFSLVLTKLSDFKVVPNLEKLILFTCDKLSEIHPSIGQLKKLILLNLEHCTDLEKLPEEINGLTSLQTLNMRDSGIKQLPSSIFFMKNLESVLGYVEGKVELAVKQNIRSYRTTGKYFFSSWFCTEPTHSFSTYLTRLNLRGCNLSGPEAFPEYFGKLVTLHYLDLSQNPFSVLPPGISGLYKLRYLTLNHCKSLRCLESKLLPSSLQLVDVNYCTSLASFLDPSNPCHLRCSLTYCLDCTELVKRQDAKMTALASLSRFLDQNSFKTISDFEFVVHQSDNELPSLGMNPPDFEFVVPQSDNELPSWFINQSSTASISIKLDPNRCNSELIGFAMVFCFRVNSSTKVNFSCQIRVRCSGSKNCWNTIVELGVTGGMMSDHLFLLFSSLDCALAYILHIEPPSYDTVEFSCLSDEDGSCGPSGVRLIYEEDREELKQITTQYYSHHSRDQKDVQCSHSQRVEESLSNQRAVVHDWALSHW